MTHGLSSVLRRQVRDTVAHVRRRWFVYLPLLLIWALAFLRVFTDPTPRVPLLFNVTPSLPYHLAWLESASPAQLERGQYVLYRFEGAAVADYPGLNRQPFFKIVRGLPGDIVAVQGRSVFVGGEFVGIAKMATFDGRRLEPIAPGVIPPGHFFVQGTSPDSFDSRYASSGLVRSEQLLGRVIPLF